MNNSTIKIGTRGSPLALWQANWVKSQLEKNDPDTPVTLTIIKTSGDASQLGDKKLDNKAQFVKEIEEALLQNEIDIAVHSMKDMPGFLPKGLVISAIPKREDPQDVIVGREGLGLEHLKEGASIGTSSIRRQCQLKQLRSDFNYIPIRGNIDTRLNKLSSGSCDAIVLAKAGLIRLAVHAAWRDLPIIPAVGQGALAIETRDDKTWKEKVEFLNDDLTATCVKAERHFLALMGGNCQTPQACYVRPVSNTHFEIQACLSETDGSKFRQVIRTAEEQGLLRVIESIVRELAPS